MRNKRWFHLTLFLCPLIAPLLALLLAPRITAQEITGDLALLALHHSFPDKTGEPVFADNDWTITAGGETFYWAGGRLLPVAEKDKLASYSPWSFEVYPESTPSPAIYSAAYVETLRRRGNEEVRGGDNHTGFQSKLYGATTRKEIESLLVSVEFLGKRINVHRDIAPALKRIENEIRATAAKEAARGNRELAEFIASIAQAGGYNWREVRGSRRMSYHSWGMAVDIQGAKPGSKAVYWLWERSRNSDWMITPLENRWKPPDFVIEAFEREGFIWGGKWPLYDNMHFEYRPELHELNRLFKASLLKASLLAAQDSAGGSPGQDLHHLYPDRLR